jgi:hypothetical protein
LTSATVRLDRNRRVDPRQTGTTWQSYLRDSTLEAAKSFKGLYMRLCVTLVGEADKYLVRGTICQIDPGSYHADIHLFPMARNIVHFSTPVVSVAGSASTWQGALDTAISRVVLAAGKPMQNLRVQPVPRRRSEKLYGGTK